MNPRLSFFANKPEEVVKYYHNFKVVYFIRLTYCSWFVGLLRVVQVHASVNLNHRVAFYSNPEQNVLFYGNRNTQYLLLHRLYHFYRLYARYVCGYQYRVFSCCCQELGICWNFYCQQPCRYP